MERPKFYKIKNTRIKLSNIKTYRLGKERFLVEGYYKAKVEGLFGSIKEKEEKLPPEVIAEHNERSFLMYRAMNNRPNMTFEEYLEKFGIVSPKIKERNFLSITTYQKETYVFYEDEGVDINKALEELDKYLA